MNGRLTLLRGEVTVTRPNVLKLASGRVLDLHIASEILVAINLGEVVEGLVGNFGNIELVVSNGQQIVINVFENGVRDVAIGSRRIAESSTVM